MHDRIPLDFSVFALFGQATFMRLAEAELRNCIMRYLIRFFSLLWRFRFRWTGVIGRVKIDRNKRSDSEVDGLDSVHLGRHELLARILSETCVS